ncbi:MAG: UDP-3-O-(3-hydroxymyristoyl)glucosamine N-acyltransferase [Planctomycetes bacterium]|nr:UDP-3-O-(3-hydroxymyristoyl)glucosamine N-acyltransferase [Planctomycetota bacterium]
MAVKSMRLDEIAALLGGRLEGDGSTVIHGIAPIQDAPPGTIAFVSNQKYVGALRTTRASAVLVSPAVAAMGLAPQGVALVILDDPYMAFARLLQRWTDAGPRRVTGVSPRAHVDETARVGADVNIHPFAFVGAGAVVGDRVDLHPGAYVGEGATVGDDTILGPNAVVHQGCKVGARCYLYAGAVVGSDGFGFAPDPRTGQHLKIPQAGIAVVEDDVEVGANVTIDRAVFGETRVGRGTKIDNMVQVGHNAVIGRGCFIVSQAGISGTSRVGNGVTIAGQAGVAGHITIGDGAVIGAQAGVHGDVKPGERVLGSPAIDGKAAKRAMAVFPRLPELRGRLREVERRLEALERGSPAGPLGSREGATP